MERCRAVRARTRAAVLLVAVMLCCCGIAGAVTRTYSTNADFDEGTLIGLEHETIADQLQLSVRPMMMPFIWLPNNDGTISKVNTDTGQEVGRYRVAPHANSAPSRTTVDMRGDCWIGVRQAGTVVKIGLYEAGEWMDRNGDGICQTSYDANDDGNITGDEILPWGEDECVLFEVVLVAGHEGTYLPGTYTGPYDYEYWGVAPRSLAIDADNNLWAGTWASSKFYHVDGATGAILQTVDVAPWGHHGYGAVMDRNGVIWSSSSGSHILRLDPRTNPPTISRVELTHNVYGLGVDYLGHLFGSPSGDARSLVRINIDTGVVEWDKYNDEMSCCNRGVAATADNDIWVANTSNNCVHRYDNDGNLKATIPAGGPAGVAVDANGKIWICDLNDENIHRVDPATNTIELTKQIVGTGGHYTYSDMTGMVAWNVTMKQGTWTTVYDGGAAATPWGTLAWNADEPAGSSVTVEVRSSEDQTVWSPWEIAVNGVSLAVTPSGRYLQIRVALDAHYSADHPVLYDLTVVSHALPLRSLSYSEFETTFDPWSVIAAGPGPADTWRRALTGDPRAHSGVYVMSSELTGQGITGLVLRLPTEPTGTAEVTLKAWAYVADRTVGDASTFFGLSFAPEIGDSVSNMLPALGWRVESDSLSQFQLLDAQEPTGVGLAVGGWHLVQIQHTRATGGFKLWLDGTLIKQAVLPAAAGRSPSYAVLAVSGLDSSAVQHVYFDDISVALVGHPRPEQNHPFALLEGQEQVVQGTTVPYTIHYGNGHPVLNPDPVTSTLPDKIYVGLSLPAGYHIASTNPAPNRNTLDGLVWELPMPDRNQAGFISLTATTPTGVTETVTGRMWAWATDDASAAGADPPSPPELVVPPDAVWGAPYDLLPQEIRLGPRPNVWVRKLGPRYASPGDIIDYAVTVGNSGDAAASIVVRDQMPSVLGGGDRILANLASLAPGSAWTGIVSGTLPWGLPGGTLVLNTAYVPSGPLEADGTDNTSSCTTTIQDAHDPNEIIGSPFGGVDRGQQLTYMLHCENVGLGTAYGVYTACTLAADLDATSLRVSNPVAMRYDPASRTLLWDIGRLNSGAGGLAWFTVRVAADACRARPLVEQAVVYFPSVPETTPTNVVFNVVNSTFSDIAWNHWAILPIEQARECGVVGGYSDGTYRPTVEVTRDQMAVFISRALAGGDSYVPAGPPTPSFLDVDATFWAYKYIEYAVANGVVGGYPDGTYRSAVPVDRGQMAVFVARALAGSDSAVPDPPATPTFPDVTPTSTWAWVQKHVEYTVARGIVSGYGDGWYHPEVICTRDQMAVFVARAFELPQ